jgi:predicted GNAT family N-acyltransferase
VASISNQPYKNDAHIGAIVKALRDGGHLLCSNLVASSKAFVVEETFRQIGGQHLIVCADKEDAAYFGRVAVKNEARGKGIGRLLVQAMEEKAQRKGYHLIKLHSQLDKAPFYIKCGYARVDDEITPDQGYPHVWMEKRL